MMAPQPDGRTRRAHLQEAAKHHAKGAAEALAGPELPESCAHVWTWFCELAVSRPAPAAPGQLPPRFTYAELDAWARLSGARPRPWEIALLRELDALWVSPELPE